MYVSIVPRVSRKSSNGGILDQRTKGSNGPSLPQGTSASPADVRGAGRYPYPASLMEEGARANASVRMRAELPAAVAVAVLLLAGCQGPDVGQSCSLQAPALADPSVTVPADYLESNPASGCENLVCIKSPPQPAKSKVKSNPYCSKPCVSNSDCSQGDTGLVCRPVTVDPNFIATLSPEARAQYRRVLGCPDDPAAACPIGFSSYCAAPLQ